MKNKTDEPKSTYFNQQVVLLLQAEWFVSVYGGINYVDVVQNI